MKYTTCNICNKLISNCNLKKHLLSHENNPKYHNEHQSVKHDGLNCIYCNKLCKNKNSLAQHECRCKSNPNRLVIIGNKYSHQAWNKGLTKDTDARVAANGQAIKAKYDSGELHVGCEGQSLADDIKQKISKTCLEHSKNGTGHKSLAKNMHYKYKDIDLDGSGEYKYAIGLDKNNIKWERPAIRFTYQLDGETHFYTPDFYLPDTNEYVEVKGYKTRKDEAKGNDFPKDTKLTILFEQDLIELGVI